MFEGLASTTTAEALAAGTGRKECLILPHAYRHLSPLVDRVDSILERIEKGPRGEPNSRAEESQLSVDRAPAF
jgi:hypothetical protein